MPTRREMLEVLQDRGVHPKAADDPHAASARAVARHADRRRPGIGNQMLKFPRKAGSHHVLRRQQRQYSDEKDAAPREDPTRCDEEPRVHRRTLIDEDASGKLRFRRVARSASAAKRKGGVNAE
jgi:hypothetical protein